jgi:type IV pilus assembly protein PilM
MLRLVQSWFARSAHPIGIDLGTDGLRMAQVQRVDNEFHLSAAASADVPSHLRSNAPARLQWFTETVRDLLSQGGFKGRQAVLSLPASMLFIQHLRLPRMDDETLKKTLPFEARGKLPIDPAHCLLRHVVAGDVFNEQEPKLEVIVMATPREFVNQLLDAAARAKLDVTGVNIEPRAVVDCFANVYRRKTDQDVVNCVVDIGASATRAMVIRGDEILFARSILLGGDHFTRAVATAMNVPFEQAKLLRVQAAAQTAAGALEERRDARQVESARPATSPAAVSSAAAPEESSFALLNAATRAPEPRPAPAPVPLGQPEQACLEPLGKLIDELNLCRRYHESTFPNRTISRLVFVGGEARQRWMCQHIARQMQLAAQVGDPLVRMGRTTEVGVESGIDRRHPQPGWAVAIGLSMGSDRAVAHTASGSARDQNLTVERGAA